MGLLNLLQTNGSDYSEFDGATPQTSVGATDQSTLHDQYSLNGNPGMAEMYFQSTLPNPAALDLDGVTPPKYLDNPPG
tara:strand:- start:388 stop:621 length:234 start_codon:yes stop_codon:yes gene_type:complete